MEYGLFQPLVIVGGPFMLLRFDRRPIHVVLPGWLTESATCPPKRLAFRFRAAIAATAPVFMFTSKTDGRTNAAMAICTEPMLRESVSRSGVLESGGARPTD